MNINFSLGYKKIISLIIFFHFYCKMANLSPAIVVTKALAPTLDGNFKNDFIFKNEVDKTKIEFDNHDSTW